MNLTATLKKISIIVPIALGVILFVQMKKNKQEPIRLEAKERVHTVRVIPLEKMDLIPRALGYGYVQPSQTWEAISEVSGKVVEVHKHLKKGHFIKKGEMLLRIDTATYGLAESKGVANVMTIEAQLKELEQSRANTQRLIEIEKRSLDISAQELKRKRGLFQKGYLSASDVESEEKRFLAQQTTVNNLQNTLELFPAQRRALLAQKDSGELTVTERRLDVAKTEIVAPFDCRLAEVNVELDQYAGVGTPMIRAESIHSAEIPVQLPPRTFMTLLPKMSRPVMPGEMDMETIRKAIGITALVHLPINENVVTWEGRFSRTSESMDMTTGAITVYVTVDEPYANVIPGKRPPLLTNMYVAVELMGRLIPEQIVVPATAVHEGRIYVAGKENRLKIVPVHVVWKMDDLAVLEPCPDALSSDNGKEKDCIVGPDIQLVLSDLVPAIEGMRLNPIPDDAASKRLHEAATGIPSKMAVTETDDETRSGKKGSPSRNETVGETVEEASK